MDYTVRREDDVLFAPVGISIEYHAERLIIFFIFSHIRLNTLRSLLAIDVEMSLSTLSLNALNLEKTKCKLPQCRFYGQNIKFTLLVGAGFGLILQW